MTPLVSIITGTYNRRASLQAFIDSVRRNIPRGMDYEIVVCDGGSTDGTLEWLRAQADVKLLEHGALLGAIKAFCDAADMATGQYILFGNDDVTLLDGSIARAIVHLETHPRCAGVGFAHNVPNRLREIIWTQDGVDYGVLHMQARSVDGTPTQVMYAQIGLFRTDLAREAGWWGRDDAIMAAGDGTYGADNYLTARLLEMGYTVDAVVGVGNTDGLMPDALRQHNYAKADGKPPAFWQRFPGGVQIGTPRTVDTPERLRVLYLPVFEAGHTVQKANKRGLREALKARGFLVYEHDYVSDRTSLKDIVALWQPHLVLTQFHGVHPITPLMVTEARNIKPDALWVNWNGDVDERGLISDPMLQMLRLYDVQLTVHAGVLPVYEREGIPAAYWQIGYEPVPDTLPIVPKWDVVFLGNAYSKERQRLADALLATGAKVGLYGIGWTDSQGDTLYDFATGAALYRNAKIAIGDNQYAARGFVSNRLFEALANGAFLLHQQVDGLEELTGLCDGVHYVAWSDFDDLRTKIAHWLKPAQNAARKRIAAAGEAFVREHHSFAARLDELFKVILVSLA